MTGMSGQRFDDLWSALRWNQQPKDRPGGISHAEHYWMLIGEMVDSFIQCQEDTVISSEWICVETFI